MNFHHEKSTQTNVADFFCKTRVSTCHAFVCIL